MAATSDDDDGQPDSGGAWYQPFDSVNAYGVGIMPAGLFGGAWEDRQNSQDALFNAAASSMPPNPFGVSVDAMLAAAWNDPDETKPGAPRPLKGPPGSSPAQDGQMWEPDRPDGHWYQPFVNSADAQSGYGILPSVAATDAKSGNSPAARNEGTDASPTPNYDMSITRRLEGTGTDPRRPYVLPPDKFPNSGATVGHGIDLSRLTASDMRAMHVPEKFITQVGPLLAPEPSGGKNAKPVYGPVGADANAIIHTADAAAGPPRYELDLGELGILQRGVEGRILSQIRNAYNAAKPATSFDDLDSAHRTALIDMAFYHGSAFGKVGKFRDLWSDIVAGNWDGAAQRLNAFDAPRSKQEACIIQTGAPCVAPVKKWPSHTP